MTKRIELHGEYWSIRLHEIVEVVGIAGDIITVKNESGATFQTTAKTLIELGEGGKHEHDG